MRNDIISNQESVTDFGVEDIDVLLIIIPYYTIIYQMMLINKDFRYPDTFRVVGCLSLALSVSIFNITSRLRILT